MAIGRRKQLATALVPLLFIALTFIISHNISLWSCQDFYVEASSSSITNGVVHPYASSYKLLSDVDNDYIPRCRLAFAIDGSTLLQLKRHYVNKRNRRGGNVSSAGNYALSSGPILNPIQQQPLGHRYASTTTTTTTTTTRRMLFNMPKTDAYQSARITTAIESRIPSNVINDLKRGKAQFPYEIKVMPSSSELVAQQDKTIILRHLEEDDLNCVVQMCVKEFGSYSSSSSSSSPFPPPPQQQQQQLPGVSVEPPLPTKIKSPLDTFFDTFENYMFGWVVRIGLSQRIQRRKDGYQNQSSLSPPSSPSKIPDHNVICLVETTNTKKNIIGIAEISLQPPIPTRTAPPYVLPLWLKRIISKIANVSEPSPYISNVLITDEYRGKGYSKLLMLACEGLATQWDFDNVYLHVDADMNSGQVAQNLYTGSGYVGVPDKKANSKYGWMGPEVMMMNQGLYMVEGVPLLYLRKILKRDKESML